MKLHFRNSYGPRLWVSIMYYDPSNCGQYGKWGTRGWWAIDYGNSAYVLNTNNRYAYFYAEADDGAVWTGPYGPIYVTQNSFNLCLWLGAVDDRPVGLGEAFDRGHAVTVGLHGEHQARAHRLAVEQHRARAAHAVLAADVRSGQAKLVAQPIDERHSRGDFSGARLAVHFDRDGETFFAHDFPRASA